MKALQITLIVSMGLLLFAAAVLPPRWLAVACGVALVAVFMVARRKRVTDVEQAKRRRWTRTALGMAIAIGFIVWALLANRRG